MKWQGPASLMAEHILKWQWPVGFFFYGPCAIMYFLKKHIFYFIYICLSPQWGPKVAYIVLLSTYSSELLCEVAEVESR